MEWFSRKKWQSSFQLDTRSSGSRRNLDYLLIGRALSPQQAKEELRSQHGRRHHESRHIALKCFADLAGHHNGRMRLCGALVVRPTQSALAHFHPLTLQFSG